MAKEFDQIERRSGLTPEEFSREYVQANRPVVLEGLADIWKERWTPDILKDKYGDQIISCETQEFFVHDKTQRKLPLRNVIDSLLSGSQEYRVRTGNFLSQVPGLQEEFRQYQQFEGFLPQVGIKRAFWLAPSGNLSSLHHDGFYENLNVQVYGRKRFIMLPPGDYKRLYRHFFASSPIDPREPDLQRYPKYAQVKPCEATLDPGDILYIPQFWWHFVITLDLSININTWGRAQRSSIRSITAQFPLVPKIVYRSLQNEAFETFANRNVKRLNSAYSFLTRRGPKGSAQDGASDGPHSPA
jgi:ribosomal protein L16 Arg81 hydroxylase